MSGSNVALQAGAGIPDAPNPLDVLGKYVGVGNALANNRLINATADSTQQGLQQKRTLALANAAASTLPYAERIDYSTPQTIAATARPFVDAIHTSVDGLVRSGVLDQKTADTLITQVASTPDVHDLVNRVKQFAQLGLDTNTSMTRTYGQGATMANGQQVQPGVARDPFMGGGFQSVGQPVQQYPSRTELLGRQITGYDAQGNPQYGPAAVNAPPSLG